MTISELGAIGEFLGSVLTLVTLVYLAIQIRQNTAQQKREELLSIQHGQNEVIGMMQDPRLAEAFVRVGADREPPIEDLMRAQNWVIQYLNHFQVIHDFYESGSLDEEQYQLWAGFAVAMVAPAGIRRWWYEENGRLAFHSGVREMIDQRLDDSANPALPITEMWTIFNVDAWEPVWRQRDK